MNSAAGALLLARRPAAEFAYITFGDRFGPPSHPDDDDAPASRWGRLGRFGRGAW